MNTGKKTAKPNRLFSKVGAVLLMAGVTSFVGFLVYFSVKDAWLQYRSSKFASVQGYMVGGEVVEKHRSKGGTYYNTCYTYGYMVNDRRFFNFRYSYDADGAYHSTQADAEAALKRHPPGSAAEVFYNPRDPSDSLLAPGLEMNDLAGLSLSGMWVLLSMFILIPIVQKAFPRKTPMEAGGVEIIAGNIETRVRLPRFQPFMTSILVTAGFMFASLFLATFLARWEDVATSALWMFALPWGVGLMLFAVLKFRLSTGSQDLVIRTMKHDLLLPLTFGRWTRMSVPFSVVTAIRLEKVRHNTKSGPYFTFAPQLIIDGKKAQRLTDFRQEDKAEAFREWLSKKIGLAPTT